MLQGSHLGVARKSCAASFASRSRRACEASRCNSLRVSCIFVVVACCSTWKYTRVLSNAASDSGVGLVLPHTGTGVAAFAVGTGVRLASHLPPPAHVKLATPRMPCSSVSIPDVIGLALIVPVVAGRPSVHTQARTRRCSTPSPPTPCSTTPPAECCTSTPLAPPSPRAR